MNQNEEWVTHTYEVIAEAHAITAAAVDMETGMRAICWPARKASWRPTRAAPSGSVN